MMQGTRALRVGLDVSVLRHGLTSGTAVYIYRLASALLRLPVPPHLWLYSGARLSPAASKLLSDLAAVGARVYRGPVPWRWSPDAAWWLPFQPDLRNLLGVIDVFHTGEFSFPNRGDVPFVTTVHDLTTELFPETHARWNRLLHRRRLSWIARSCTRVIVDSLSTGRDLLRLHPDPMPPIDHVPLARGTISPNGSSTPSLGAEVRTRYRLGSGPFVFCAGTLEPRKNLGRLVSAFESLPESLGNVRLVIAGGKGWRDSPIWKALLSSPRADRISTLGFVPADDLQALYREAEVFAFPSIYEGFGLPLLEAMAAGTPVLTSDVSSMPEVVGDAAMLVDPLSVDSIRAGLERLLQDSPLRLQLADAGRAREELFTWERTACLTLDSYSRALAQSRRSPA
jgi:glycosyltransferase involved in cell wall biosynthesis